jgi:phosphoglycerol transferase MdoB-like AlkP superfamily enzyme
MSVSGGICMKKYQNMGQIDRIIRFIVGTGLIVLLFLLESNWRYLGILGIVLVLTAALGVCPLYMPFKIDTRKKTK